MSPPDPSIDAQLAQALALRAEGRLEEALAVARRRVAQAPDVAAQLLIAGLCVESGRLSEGEAWARRVVALDDGLAQAWWWLGVALLEQGRPRAAIPALIRAQAEPGLAEGARLALVRAHQAAEDPAAALAAAEPSLQDLAWALELGPVYAALGRVDAAAAGYAALVQADPTAVAPLLALARLAGEGGDVATARDRLDQARARAQSAADWRAVADESWRWAADETASDDDLRRALALDPDDRAAAQTLAMRLLRRGDWAAGWALYRRRLSARIGVGITDERPAPARLDGRRVLLLRDQGVGDEIFFWRFAPELRRRGARIVLLASEKTAPLARRLGVFDQVAARSGEIFGAMDHTLLVGDLPWWLGWSGVAPSLRLDPAPAALDQATALLAPALAQGPVLGLLWRGGHPSGRGTVRRAPKDALLGAARAWRGGVAFFQRNAEPEEIAAAAAQLDRAVVDVSQATDDIELALALNHLCPAYVGVDTTDCHLRALLGQCGEVLAPVNPDYRWGLAGDHSAWLPAFRLYREDPRAGWGDAFARIAALLASDP